MVRDSGHSQRGDISLILILLIMVVVVSGGAYFYLKGTQLSGNNSTPTPTSTIVSTLTPTSEPTTVAQDMKQESLGDLTIKYPTDWYKASFSTSSHLTIYSYPHNPNDRQHWHDSADGPADDGERMDLVKYSKPSSSTLKDWLMNEADDYEFFGNRKYTSQNDTTINGISGYKVQLGNSYPYYLIQNSSGTEVYLIMPQYMDSKFNEITASILSTIIVK